MSRDYALLDVPEVKAVLAHPPDAERTHAESGTYRALYDCPDIALTPMGPRVRLIVAAHPASSASASIGKQRDGLVYELFVTHLPSPAFSPQDVLRLTQLLEADWTLAPVTAAHLALRRSLYDNNISSYATTLDLHRADQPV